MGAGIQQPTVEQGSGGNAWLDVFKVLFEPGAVFERVRTQPSFLAPYVTIMAVQIILFFVNMSYLTAAVQNQMATQAPGRRVPPARDLVPVVLGVLLSSL